MALSQGYPGKANSLVQAVVGPLEAETAGFPGERQAPRFEENMRLGLGGESWVLAWERMIP